MSAELGEVFARRDELARQLAESYTDEPTTYGRDLRHDRAAEALLAAGVIPVEDQTAVIQTALDGMQEELNTVTAERDEAQTTVESQRAQLETLVQIRNAGLDAIESRLQQAMAGAMDELREANDKARVATQDRDEIEAKLDAALTDRDRLKTLILAVRGDLQDEGEHPRTMIHKALMQIGHGLNLLPTVINHAEELELAWPEGTRAVDADGDGVTFRDKAWHLDDNPADTPGGVRLPLIEISLPASVAPVPVTVDAVLDVMDSVADAGPTNPPIRDMQQLIDLPIGTEVTDCWGRDWTRVQDPASSTKLWNLTDTHGVDHVTSLGRSLPVYVKVPNPPLSTEALAAVMEEPTEAPAETDTNEQDRLLTTSVHLRAAREGTLIEDSLGRQWKRGGRGAGWSRVGEHANMLRGLAHALPARVIARPLLTDAPAEIPEPVDPSKFVGCPPNDGGDPEPAEAEVARGAKWHPNVAELDALPEGTVLLDRDEDEWRRAGRGWGMNGRRHEHPSATVLDYTPLTVKHEPETQGEAASGLTAEIAAQPEEMASTAVGASLTTWEQVMTLPNGSVVKDDLGLRWTRLLTEWSTDPGVHAATPLVERMPVTVIKG